jgi:divalent metal cation (Fe/Co/Zn/Cd) transporter
MSVVLLISSLLFTVTHIPFLDSLGAAGLAYFSFTEGRESFEKAAGKECDDCPESA